MQSTLKHGLISIGFVCVLLLGMITHILSPDKTFSETERRELRQIGSPKLTTLLNGDYTDRIEPYLLDQFVKRETLRSIHSMSRLYLFNQRDVNGRFLHDGQIHEHMHPLNTASLNHAIQLMEDIKEEDFESVDTYHTYIPDKNRYLDDPTVPKMDYDAIRSSMRNATFDSTYLDLESKLTLDHYYRTDHHWRQETLPSLTNHLLSEMEGISLDANYDEATYDPFHGVYHGQLALPIEGETLRWLQNETLSQSYRYDPVAKERAPIYEKDYLDEVDPYNLFLGGDRPITELHNPESERNRHLVIFGDSFTNSLAPLLLEEYSKITFIDLRHMNPSAVSDFVTDDVDTLLFMYSNHILNDSWMLD